MLKTDPEKDKIVRRRIATWYRKYRRDLQWRSTKDPYEILISETMLQQTQVARVREKLPVFLGKFPSFAALATASRSDVLRAWQGMGYNNRAVRLHALAKIVRDKHNGVLPASVDELILLPGIGRYTANAVACFAYMQRVPVVDVNVQRVFSRIYRRMPSFESLLPEKEIWDLAAKILPREAYDWNQALMDLGALVCTARNPRCGTCPVFEACASKKIIAHHKNDLLKRKPASASTATIEPHYGGVPRRLWRGRIVEVLRGLETGNSMTLQKLGKTIKKDFQKADLRWLSEIARLLAKDGIINLRRAGLQYHAALSHE